MSKKIVLPIITFFLIISFQISAQNLPKLSGLVFGDYFYNVQQNDNGKNDINGFQFRRIYFTTDFKISEKFSTRFRLESSWQSSNFNTIVKDAWLKWNDIFEGSDVIVGLSPTPAFSISEEAWGYRFLEKTILDYNKIVSSRDMGLDLKGNLTSNGKIKYWLKIGNNSKSGLESDKFKRYYSMLQFNPAKNLTFTAYFDYASSGLIEDGFTNSFKKNNSIVSAVFAGYSYKDLNLGIESFYRKIENNFHKSTASPLSDQNSYGVSVWSHFRLNEKLKLVCRFDYFEPNSDLSKDENSLILLAADFLPDKSVHFAPNIEIVTYGSGDPDIVPRISFYWKF
ncbi:hypothetical protein ACSSWA_12125 [Melioribacter sp. Ez-97]|uniref:hypothetical protein n=1 Tax=Melioribacter sp. Ez-97 TaxID=3423434 RepID=UPI003EDADDC0